MGLLTSPLSDTGYAVPGKYQTCHLLCAELILLFFPVFPLPSQVLMAWITRMLDYSTTLQTGCNIQTLGLGFLGGSHMTAGLAHGPS